MLRFAIRGAPLAGLSLLLCGCLSFGAIATRGTAINEGVGSLQNRTVLLNLVRAGQGEPLFFTSIDQVIGEGAARRGENAPGQPDGAAGRQRVRSDQRKVAAGQQRVAAGQPEPSPATDNA